MRALPPLCLAALQLATSGCGGGGVCPECFGGVTATVTVTDATTGQPVAGLTFTESAQPVSLSCLGAVPDGGACKDWVLDGPTPGKHILTVSAPGYASGTATFTIDAPSSGPCGCGEGVSATVALTPG